VTTHTASAADESLKLEPDGTLTHDESMHLHREITHCHNASPATRPRGLRRSGRPPQHQSRRGRGGCSLLPSCSRRSGAAAASGGVCVWMEMMMLVVCPWGQKVTPTDGVTQLNFVMIFDFTSY